MNVLLSLAREHAILGKLLARLEASASKDERIARRDMRNTLLVLLSALDKHEHVEQVVFGNPSYASSEGVARILSQIEFQHQEIQELRLELLEAVTSSDKHPFEHLQTLIRQMADRLRIHFEAEERCLWPHYESCSRSIDASIRWRLEQNIKALELDIAANSAAMSEYLGMGK